VFCNSGDAAALTGGLLTPEYNYCGINFQKAQIRAFKRNNVSEVSLAILGEKHSFFSHFILENRLLKSFSSGVFNIDA